MIEFLCRVSQNLAMNVGAVGEENVSESDVSIIWLIIAGFIACAVAYGVGMIFSAVFKGFGVNFAGMLASVVGTISLLNANPNRELIEHIIGIIMILIGLAGAGITLFTNKRDDWGYCSKKLMEGYAYYYAAFVLSFFALSPAWYAMLPEGINKWCIYIPLFMCAFGSVSELFGSYSEVV